jgi:hypothetical protein
MIAAIPAATAGNIFEDGIIFIMISGIVEILMLLKI